MKRYTLVLASVLTFWSPVFSQGEPEIRDRLVGTWKLVSTEQTLKNGTTHPYPQYGANGKGFLMTERSPIFLSPITPQS